MKVAVINFSGNVGKTTVARHLLKPRIPGSEMITVESINADDGQAEAIRGKQFGELQEYLQTVENVVVDIGASNVEDFLGLMRKFKGSHEDFDYFVIPTVPAMKQQKDTIATLAELAGLGIPKRKLKVLFNMAEDGAAIESVFGLVCDFARQEGLGEVDARRVLYVNEVFQRAKQAGNLDIVDLAGDQTDYKSRIAATADKAEQLGLANRLATRRLATGVLPELDACFEALELT